MPNLTNMEISAVALVDRGANKKRFYLRKAEGDLMNKELLLAILSGSLTPEQAKQLIEGASEADRPELQAAWDACVAEEKPEVMMDQEAGVIAEACANKVKKATEDQIKVLTDAMNAIKVVLEQLAADKKPAEAPAEAVPAAKVEDTVTKDEVSKEDFQKMLEAAIAKSRTN